MKVNRYIIKPIREILKKYPILAVTGPRQSGKTTMLKNLLSDYRYINLENPDLRAYAQQDTKGFLKEYDDKVIFDEVQQAPELFSYLQVIVDENQIMGQYILSGSQNFQLMQSITQTLAGRVALFRLFPFDNVELSKENLLIENLSRLMTTGFYPAIYDRDINPDKYYADYVDTYVNRDVTQLVNIQNASSFKRFIKLCAIRSGHLINFNNLARDAGVSHTTAKNWLSILETSYIIFMLPPYFKNYSKRLIKSSKLYFYDTGLLCHLLGIRKSKLSPNDKYWGNIFETMVVSEYVKQLSHHSISRDLWFWRDSNGHEVDLLYDEGFKLNLFEIKSTSTISSKMFKGLNYLSKIADDDIAQKTVIYGGENNQKRTEFDIVSWKNLQIK